MALYSQLAFQTVGQSRQLSLPWRLGVTVHNLSHSRESPPKHVANTPVAQLADMFLVYRIEQDWAFLVVRADNNMTWVILPADEKGS